MLKEQKTFDPEGSGYDYESAEKYGIEPDELGHWQSRVPETGLILKGKRHETFNKTIKGEEEAGYEIYKGADGRYYSKPKHQEGDSVLLQIPDPVDVDIYSPLPSDLDMLDDIWTQGRIDSAGKSMRTAMGMNQVLSPNSLERKANLRDWWTKEGRHLPSHVLDQIGITPMKPVLEREVEERHRMTRNVKGFLGIEEATGDPLVKIMPVTGAKVDTVTGATVKLTEEEKQQQEVENKLRYVGLEDLRTISDTIVDSPLDFAPELAQAVKKEIRIKEHLPKVMEVINEKPLTILLGTDFFDKIAGGLTEYTSRKGISPVEAVMGVPKGEHAAVLEAVSRVREMILAEDPRITTQMALGMGETTADLIKFVLLSDPSKLKAFAKLPKAVKAAIGVGTRAGLVELLKLPEEGEDLTERAAVVAKTTGIGAVTGLTLSLLFSGAKALFIKIRDLPVSKQVDLIMQQAREAQVAGGSGQIKPLTHAETVTLLKHLKSTDPEQFAKAIGYKVPAKKIPSRVIPTGFRAGMAEIEKAGEVGKEIVKGITKGKQIISAAAAKALPKKALPVKTVKPTKILTKAEALSFQESNLVTGEEGNIRIVANAKMQRSIQADEKKIAVLKTKLAQQKADKKVELARATKIEIAKKQDAIEILREKHGIKLETTIEGARARIAKIREAKQFQESLRKDALSMIQAIPRENRIDFVRRAAMVKTDKGLQKLAIEIDEGIAKIEKRIAIRGVKDTFSKLEHDNRLGKVRFGKVPSPQREALIRVTDSVDLKKLSEAKEGELESLQKHVQRMAIDFSGELSALDKSEPDDPTGFVPKRIIQELGRLSKTNINDMETEDIRMLEVAAQSIAHEAKLKGQLLVKQGLKPLDGTVKKVVNEITPSRAGKKAATKDVTVVEKGRLEKAARTARRLFLADLHLDRLVEVATGNQRDAIVDILDTQLHKGQRLASDKLVLWTDKSAERFKELGFTDFNQIDEKVTVTLAGQKIKLPLDYLVKLERHWRSPDNLRALSTTKGLSIAGKEYDYPIGMNPVERIREVHDALDKVRNNPMLMGLADWSGELNKEQADAINETMLLLQGYEIARDPTYTSRPRQLPKRVGGRTDISKAAEQQGQYLPRSGGTQRMRLERWSMDFQRSLESDVFLHGMAVPLRNARILVESDSFQQAMKTAGREDELKAITLILSRTQGTPTNSTMVDVFGRHLQRAVGVAGLGFRMSSGGTAMMSYPAIGSEASARSMARPTGPVSKGYLDKMRQDSSVLEMRKRGRRINAEVGISGSVDSFSLLFFGKPSSIDSKSFIFVQTGDGQAIGNIHKTSVKEILTTPRNGKNINVFEWEGKNVADLSVLTSKMEDGYPVDKQVRYAAARRAEYLTRRSQPMYDSLDRSSISGNPNIAVTTFLPFRTAINAQFNVATSAINDYIKSPKSVKDTKKLLKAFGALGASATAVAMWKKGFKWAKNTGIKKIKEAFGIFSFDEREDIKTWEDRADEVLVNSAKNIGKLSTGGKFLVQAAEIAADQVRGEGWNWNRDVLDNPALEMAEEGVDAGLAWPSAIASLGKLDEFVTGDDLTETDIKFNKQLLKDVVSSWVKAVKATASAGVKIAKMPVIAPYQEWIAPALRDTKIKVIREVTYGDVEDPRLFATKVAKLYEQRKELSKRSKSKRLDRDGEEILAILNSFESTADATALRASMESNQVLRKDEFEKLELIIDSTFERLSEYID